MKAVLWLGMWLACFSVSAQERPRDVEIVSAEFGVFDASNPRETLFGPTRLIPHKVGQRYGWVIEVRTRKRSLSVREEYLLPNRAAEATEIKWADVVALIPLERRSQVSQRQLVPQDGRIFGEWEIGPNEPAGRRHLQVVVEDEIAASFEYEVK